MKRHCNIPYCSDVEIDNRECKSTRRGIEYTGTLAHTVEGQQCIKWPHDMHNFQFPDYNVTFANNYCRNAWFDWEEASIGPWCYYTVDRHKRGYCDIPYCSNVTVNTEECRRTPDGFDYAGNMSTTIEGYQCQKWADQTPHWHQFGKYNHEFPANNVTAASNYCRHVHGERPSCYITDPDVNVKKECIIPMCSEPAAGTHPECKKDRRGLEYMGKINITRNGTMCWPWTSITSQLKQDSIEIDQFPDANIDEALNYCRNVNNDKLGPWCYYNSGEKSVFGSPVMKKQYCGIPVCGLSEELNEMYKKYTHTSKLKTPSWIAADIIMMLVCPICLIFGSVSNVLAFAVFLRKSVRESTSAFLLIILTLFDALSLYMGAFPRWLRRVSGLYLESRSDSSCQVYNYFLGVVTSFPAWILIAGSYARYIAISKPLEAKFICTRKKVSKWLALIFICIFLLNIPKALYSKAWYQIMFDEDEVHFMVHKSCQVTSRSAAWIDSISRCLLPFFILLVCNICIICLLRENLNNRLELSVSVKEKEERRSVHSQTFVLLTASFSYLLFALPYVLYILIMPALRYAEYDSVEMEDAITTTINPLGYKVNLFYVDYKIIDKTGIHAGEDHGKYKAAMYLWYIISISFMYINNSVNFYLYCLGGATFRDEFRAMMSCCYCKSDEVNEDGLADNAEAADIRAGEGNDIELVLSMADTASYGTKSDFKDKPKPAHRQQCETKL